MPEPALTNEQAQSLLHAAGISGYPEVALLKRHNHVFRLTCNGDVYFLKTYTKDWYGGDVAGTGYHVNHEASAYRLLAAYGLTTPTVVATDSTLSNPLGWPYLITGGLAGQPLTEALHAHPAEHAAALHCVGEYLAAMHAVALPFPGYISHNGPTAMPDPDGWQHPHWTLNAFLKNTRATWAEDRRMVTESCLERMEALLAEQAEPLEAAYAVPHFLHGDCHAHQFFVQRGRAGGWQVTGVVDMEVASAGDCGADLVKLFLELAGTQSAATRWWEPFFAGYGAVDFNLLKLRLVAAAHVNYTCLGPQAWPGSRAEILARLLEAEDWAALLDPQRRL